MKWLETIKIQAASGQEGVLESELRGLVKNMLKSSESPGLPAVTLYKHVSVPGCFAVHLLWDTKSAEIRGSMFGMRLTQSFKIFGMVDHSAWIRKEQNPNI